LALTANSSSLSLEAVEKRCDLKMNINVMEFQVFHLANLEMRLHEVKTKRTHGRLIAVTHYSVQASPLSTYPMSISN
jgi:hypothetical protein